MWYDDMSVLMILLLYRYLRKVLKIDTLLATVLRAKHAD